MSESRWQKPIVQPNHVGYRYGVSILNKLSLRPSIWLICGTTFVLASYFAGPFSYKVRYTDGFYYFTFCWLAFFIGMFLTEQRGNFVQDENKITYEFTKARERRLCLYMFFLLISFLVSAYYLFYIANIDFSEGVQNVRKQSSINEYTDMIGGGQAWLFRLTQFLTYGSPAIYLIISQLDRTHYKITQLSGIICLLFPACFVLMRGGRSAAFTSIFIMILSGIVRYKRGMHFISPLRRVRIIFYVLAIIAIYFFWLTFTTRANFSNSLDLSESLFYMNLITGGTIKLKEGYQSLNDLTGGRLSQLYKLNMYISHGLPVFSDVFYEWSHDRIFFGAFHFRTLVFILRFVGIPLGDLEREMAAYQPYNGQFATAIQGFLLDFGFYGTFPALLMLGVLLGSWYNKARDGKYWALCLLPMVHIIVLIFPVSYIRLSGSDFIIFVFFVLFFCTGLKPGIKDPPPKGVDLVVRPRWRLIYSKPTRF